MIIAYFSPHSHFSFLKKLSEIIFKRTERNYNFVIRCIREGGEW